MFSVITNLQSFGYAVLVWKVPTFILYIPSVLDKHLSTIQIDFLFSVESNTLSLYCKLWHKKNLFVAEAFGDQFHTVSTIFFTFSLLLRLKI